MSLRVQKQIKLPSFVQGSSSDNAVSSDDVSSCDEYSDSCYLYSKFSLNCFSYDESSDDSSYFDDDSHDLSFEESFHPDELDVTIAHGVVWFWLFDKWQSVSNEQWAWRYLVVVDDDGVRNRLWAPRLLLNNYQKYDSRHKRRPLLRPSPSRQHTPFTEETVTSLVFNFIHNSDFNPGHWARTSYDSSGYKDRKLVRTCRLVCRDWAKRAPIGDPKLTVTNGVVWHRVEDEWQALPKRHWAWVFQKIEWWVERRQQDNIKWKWRAECKAWYPKLIQPIDESVRPKSKEKSALSSLIVTIKPYRTRLEPLFGPRFLQNVRDMDDRKLYRTCRLVCRDWAKQAPLGDPKLTVTNGVVWHRVEDEWQALPKRHWVWIFRKIEWWVERRQQDNHGWKSRDECKAWYPELIPPIDDTMLSKGKGRSNMSLPPVTKKQFRTHLEPSIGHRFLQNVRDLDDRKLYRTCRLVCREWVGQYPVGKPELCNFNVSGGTIRYWMADSWHPLPNKYWAWSIENVEWWAGRRFKTFLSQTLGDKSKGWHPKLIQDVDGLLLKSYFSLTSARPVGCGRTFHASSASSSEVFNLTAANTRHVRQKRCVPKPSKASLEYTSGTIEPLQRRDLPDTRIRDIPAAMKMIASWTFRFIRRADLRTDYADRELARTCRLVCRDWARELPLGDPQLKVAEGAVWYHFEEGWQHLPKSYWAWTHQEPEWWMETRKQDRCWSYYIWGRVHRDKCKAWYPRLVQPADDLIQSKSNDRSMTLSVAIAAKPIRAHLEASIGPLFQEYIHDIGDRALYRTCRLVCRDWARRYPFRNRERIRLMHCGGVALYWSEGNWRVLPNAYWVWAFEKVDWWAERRHSNSMPRAHMRKQCWGKGWVIKLVQPVDDCIGQDLSNAPFPTRRHRRKEQVWSTLPPELFKYICNAADWRSSSFRLVCRYWNRQCTPHVFADIDISNSPERIRALSQFKRDPKCQFAPHVKLVYNVPIYEADTSKFPWLHLLTQMSLSAGFALWEDIDDDDDIDDRMVIQGPIWGGHRTIRSIHFGLPRSHPSFSRGIRFLELRRVNFNRFDDLANLVCELPDLEELKCTDASFMSIPTDLAHRRPRRCHNNLREVYFGQVYNICTDYEGQSAVSFLLTTLSLYLSVYDVASFFSEDEVASSFTLAAPLLTRDFSIKSVYTHDSNSLKLSLDFVMDNDLYHEVLLYSFQGTLKLRIAIHVVVLEELGQAGWQSFDNAFRTSRSQMPAVPIHIIFGFDEREEMLEVAEDLPSIMPAAAEATTLTYAMVACHNDYGRCWYQASLDSEELCGELKERLSDVYPIEALGSEDMDSKDMDSEDSDSN